MQETEGKEKVRTGVIFLSYGAPGETNKTVLAYFTSFSSPAQILKHVHKRQAAYTFTFRTDDIRNFDTSVSHELQYPPCGSQFHRKSAPTNFEDQGCEGQPNFVLVRGGIAWSALRLGEVRPHGTHNLFPADGAVLDGGGTGRARHQVAAGKEHHPHVRI